MSDLALTLATKMSAKGMQPKAYFGLRVAITTVAVLTFLVVAVLWFRSYTWRDRIVVPLGDTWFCRFDSDYGKFEYESYGPNMGKMSFSMTALSHDDISDAWRRFTDAPQPGSGRQWRWEKSDTGRFFIHVPHWFLVVLALATASAPWFPWQFSLRTLLVVMAALAVFMGLIVWINAPPRRPDPLSGRMEDVEQQNRGISSDESLSENSNLPKVPSLDFAKLLSSLDKAIGNRVETSPMEGIESAAYQNNGPIEKVVDVVAPIVSESGFSAETGDVAQAAAKSMKEVMAGGVLKVVDHKLYTHPNGELLTVARMEAGNSGMMMLTLTYMNPSHLQSAGDGANSRE